MEKLKSANLNLKSIKNINKKQFSKTLIKKIFISSAIAAMFAVPSYASDDPIILGTPEANSLLLEKPIKDATLDYLNKNNILIPQKDAEPIQSPGSSYSIVEGTGADHSFEYLTADENGNLTTEYYNFDFSSIEDPKNLENSENITWKELTEAPEEGTLNAITVKFPNDVTKYYQYTYKKPESYTSISERINDTLSTSNVTDVVFQDIEETADGGVIYNTVDNSNLNIVADFINNYISNSNSSTNGGAIYNSNAIGNITGDFINNYALNSTTTTASYSSSFANGGAIYNNLKTAVIESITGDFINNYTSATTTSTSYYSKHYANGGAIYNNLGTIGNITGNFINNYTYVTASKGPYVYANGGAIYNGGTIGNITGDFINNYTRALSNYAYAYGGAIYNTSTIANITGNFISNYAYSSSYGINSYGGAIYNTGTIGSITGDFISNYIISYGGGASAHAYGGVIYNTGTITNITGDFMNSYGYSHYSNVLGGAIYNNGTITNITGNFINNRAYSDVFTASFVNGGAIYNSKVIGSITGDFINNYVSNPDYGYSSSYKTEVYGGAIYNSGTITSITGNFIDNYTSNGSPYMAASGGAIYNKSGAKIGSITGDFINNYAVNHNTNASAYAYGGAIYNDGTIDSISGSFIGNNAKTHGGAIYNTGNLTINADNKNLVFSGNFIQPTRDEKLHEAIYVDNSDATLTLKAQNNGKITLKDYVNGVTSGYNVKLTGDSTGTIDLYNDLKNANVTTEKVTVNMADGKTHDYNVVTWNSEADTMYNFDIDFTNKTTDKIITSADSNGTVTLSELKFLNEPIVTTDTPYEIQILDTPTDTLQLALSDELKEALLTEDKYKIGVIYEDIPQDVNATTKWNDQYNIFEQQTDIYYKIDLATTNTTNDSIALSVNKIKKNDLTFKEKILLRFGML